jgi:hypothetical protein
MRCPHDQSRDRTEASLRGDVRNRVVFRKQSRSSRLFNAHDKLRAGPARTLPKQGV